MMMSMMSMMPAYDMTDELTMKLTEAKAISKSNGTEGLVPTTVSEHEDGGYHSDDFYLTEDKINQSANCSGTSTPLTLEDMDMFATIAESWQDDLTDATFFTDSAVTGTGTTTTDTTTDNSTYTTTYTALSASSPQSGEQTHLTVVSSDEESEEEGDNSLPDILRRPVKGMTVEEKRMRRRELNRLAAQRSRQKKRMSSTHQQKEEVRLVKRNAELKVELAQLEEAKANLYALIKNHFKGCNPKANIINTNNNNLISIKPEPAELRHLQVPVVSHHAVPVEGAPALQHHDEYRGYFSGYGGSFD